METALLIKTYATIGALGTVFVVFIIFSFKGWYFMDKFLTNHMHHIQEAVEQIPVIMAEGFAEITGEIRGLREDHEKLLNKGREATK